MMLVSSGGVRSIWLRHDLATINKRLNSLEERSAKEGIVYTEEQVRALEVFKMESDTSPDVIETEHPGYLISQDKISNPFP